MKDGPLLYNTFHILVYTQIFCERVLGIEWEDGHILLLWTFSYYIIITRTDNLYIASLFI